MTFLLSAVRSDRYHQLKRDHFVERQDIGRSGFGILGGGTGAIRKFQLEQLWERRAFRAIIMACIENEDTSAAKKLRDKSSLFASNAANESWVPSKPMGGTELMVEGLRQRLGVSLNRINLQINAFSLKTVDERPLVVWFHHDITQSWVEWCHDRRRTDRVSRFVFVSDWQRERYLRHFKLPPERCVVLRNATEVSPDFRKWSESKPLRCAYISTPFRGLSVLLKAWEQLRRTDVELHVWSSMKLYCDDLNERHFEHLYALARSNPSITYHGLLPNRELCLALRDVHFLTYPSTFEETSCLAVIEAMAAGCRIIVPYLGALPETTAGFARLYPWHMDEDLHAAEFARVLASELKQPWDQDPELSEAQQRYCHSTYHWKRREFDWSQLIEEIAAHPSISGAGK